MNRGAPGSVLPRRGRSAAAALHAAQPLADVQRRGLLVALLGLGVLWSLLQVDAGSGLLRANGLGVLGSVVGGLLTPDLSPGTLASVGRAAWATTVYAVAGLSLAIVLGLPLGVLASGVLLRGRARALAVAAGRGTLAALRAMHELVWAWLFVAALGLSPLAAVLALALPFAGILGRIFADLLNDVPEAPLASLRASGAGEVGVLFYGRLPMSAADMLAYTFYRFECAVRSSAIMGFVGVGGLGLQIQLALADLRFEVVGAHLLGLLALILAIELWSGAVRRALSE